MLEAQRCEAAGAVLRPRAVPHREMITGVEGTGRTGWQPPGRPPRVWAVLCYRAGDNEQVLALAEALGWPFEVKRLAYRPYGRTIDVLRLTTLAGILRDEFGPARRAVAGPHHLGQYAQRARLPVDPAAG